MAHEPDNERVVGVYRDEQAAAEAARAARAAGADDVRVDAPEDEVAALRGEMREESAESWGGPSIALYTPEMARSVPIWTAAGALVGALVALPLGFIPAGDVSMLARLVIAGFCGAFAGGTIGFIVGGGFFGPRRKSQDRLAAEQGVVVGAEDGADVADALESRDDVIRVDKMAPDGQPEETLTTERQREG